MAEISVGQSWKFCEDFCWFQDVGQNGRPTVGDHRC